MYTMLEACKETGLTYQTLKFYCNQNLVPNVQRDKNNRRIFDQNNVDWIKNLSCLKNCGMTIKEIKVYLALCLEGQQTISERKMMLDKKQKEIQENIKLLQESSLYIDKKQEYYDGVLNNEIEYSSFFVKS